MIIGRDGSQPTNVFRLSGADENSASFALGWVLERSPNYLSLVAEEVFGEIEDLGDVVITLQKHGEDGGYTDVEIQAGHRFHAILEAKRGWGVATEDQLMRYVPRIIAGGAKRQRLISVSAAARAQAMRRLPRHLNDIGIVHLSWGHLQRLAKKAQEIASGFEEKLWLRQLIQHLQEFMSMDRKTNNRVYVVSLGSKEMVPGQAYSWKDVVVRDKCYFHPVGKSWPVEPPNYIGFRYDGRLQSVHHIERFEIVDNLAACNSLWPQTTVDHFVYSLGPPMKSARPLPTGKGIRQAARVWCAIDTLLSGEFDTITDARDGTERRLGAEL